MRVVVGKDGEANRKAGFDYHIILAPQTVPFDWVLSGMRGQTMLSTDFSCGHGCRRPFTANVGEETVHDCAASN